ncbi:MAG: multicopper oxidase CueO [Acetobacteraceae bacterium]|nr:multicopper oxidase CueO [Pseudomonadota bacterium]
MTRRLLLASAAATAASPGPSAAADRPALPIPPELRPDASGSVTLDIRPGTMTFLPGRRTPTYGVNGPFLGPALRVRRGQTVAARVTNALPEDTTLHWHGLIIPGEADGGPHRILRPGQRWEVKLAIDQPAATLWFHPHMYPTTAHLVTKGIAGLLIVDDDETDRLALPSRWGVDDIPVVIQDRRFRPDGSFFERFNIIAVTNGYIGDTVLVNGAIQPEARTARGWLRLRLLNGSNARSYILTTSDARPLFVIGSDGGLLAAPVELKQLPIHAGERFEVMVDARNGVPFDLLTLPVSQPIMRLPPFDQPLKLLTLRPDGADGSGQLPSALATLPPLPVQLPPVSQELVMDMFRDMQGMMPLQKAGLVAMAGGGRIDPAVVARVTDLIVNGKPLGRAEQLSSNGVNGKPFAMHEPGFTAALNQPLRWRIAEGSDRMMHPVHIHGCQFRILSQDGKPPEAHRAGWKDIAPISGGGSSEILVRFPYRAGRDAPYMAHCHILEHEDSGMMAQFTVA